MTTKFARSFMATSIFLALPLTVHGQDLVLEEVIVTAQKRAESLQDVPVSVNAISGDQVREGIIANLDDVASQTPNFTMTQFNIGQPRYAIRGVLSALDSAASDSAVATFIDEVYLGRPAGGSTDLYDLERIEVLRGPQGTLFGKNVVGGALSLHTRPPSQEFDANVSVTAGNYGLTVWQGLITGPLTDTVSAKLVAQKKDRDGYVEDALNGSDYQDLDNESMRGQLEFNPSDDLSILFGVDYSKDDTGGNCRSVNNLDVLDDGTGDLYREAVAATTRGDIRKCASSYDHFAKREVKGGLLRVEWNLKGSVLTSITAYRDMDYRHQDDYVPLPLGSTPLNFLASVQEESDQFTQEIRLTSVAETNLSWQVGAFYMEENVDRSERLTATFGPPLDDSAAILLNGDFAYTQDAKTKSYAVFGQIDYDFNDQWSLSLGSRYTHDEKQIVQGLVNFEDPAFDTAVLSAALGVPSFVIEQIFAPEKAVILGVPANGPDELGAFAGSGDTSVLAFPYSIEADKDWSKVTSSASLKWNFSDNGLLYLKFAQGYKSGAYVSSINFPEAAAVPLDPEDVDSWELGMRSEFLGKRLRVNATVFSMKYDNLQVLRLVDGLLVGSNAKATSEGVELDVSALLNEKWSIQANYAYLDATYDSYVDGDLDFTGNDLPQAPRDTFFVRSSYISPLPGGSSIDWVISYSYSGSYFFEPSNELGSKERSYGLLDASASWTSPREKWVITAWGKNLNDEDVRADTIIGLFSGTLDIWGPPRTYGVTVRYSI